MSFTPRLKPEEFEHLFRLYTTAFNEVGISPKETRKFQIQLREELQKIWDAIEPKPMPMNFEDFRQLMREEFLKRLRREDPRFPSV
jgi:hypothetical protein